MDFFAAQARARTNTRLLMLYFGLALLVITLGVYVLALLLFASASDGNFSASGELPRLLWWRPGVLMTVVVGVGLVVGGGSLVKIALLRRAGGAGVAESLGGRRVERDTTDFAERRLLNLVEEMSLAAGMPVPQVYVLDKETGINAFAAGFSPNEAVVAVTRGCLEQFNRDELQAVIGHEMSHIVHGDMSLNLRLMGVIFGLLMLWMLGRWLFALAPRRGSGNKNQGNQLVLFGLGLLILGAVGLFFGRLIQAAASRQREYLADASAVQFTRNPLGLRDALIKIARAGSGFATPAAEQASHLFFADGVGRALKGGKRAPRRVQQRSGWLATHPPLLQRIQRLDPHIDAASLLGASPTPSQVAPQTASQTASQAAGSAGMSGRVASLDSDAGTVAGFAAGQPASEPLVAQESTAVHRGLPPGEFPNEPLGGQKGESQAEPQAADLVESAGQLDGGHLAYVQYLLAQIPPALQQAAHQPASAAVLVRALFCLSRPEQGEQRIRALAQPGDGALAEQVRQLSALPAQTQLLLFDLAMPSVAALSKPDRHALLQVLGQLAQPDLDAGLFDLLLLVRLYAGASEDGESVGAESGSDAKALRSGNPGAAMNLLFSGLALAAGSGPDSERAFAAACERAPVSYAWRLLPGAQLTPGALIGACRRLARLHPERKRALVAACEAAVIENSSVSLAEGQLLRLICALLAVPVPPLLPGQLRYLASAESVEWPLRLSL